MPHEIRIIEEKPVIWYRDMRLLAGIILVVLSFALGLYSKGLLGLFFANLLNSLYKPFYLLTGVSVYALSWILLFTGILLVGMETVRLIKQRIHHHVRQTYHYTRNLPKKGYNYTKELHKKSIARIKKSIAKND